MCLAKCLVRKIRIFSYKPFRQISFSSKYLLGTQLKLFLVLFSLTFFFLRPTTRTWTEVTVQNRNGELGAWGERREGVAGCRLRPEAQGTLGIVVSQSPKGCFLWASGEPDYAPRSLRGGSLGTRFLGRGEGDALRGSSVWATEITSM